MMRRVVLDTNVLVSAAIKRYGAEAAVLELVVAGELILFVSRPILNEYRSVLLRAKLRLDPVLVNSFLEFMQGAAILVHPVGRLRVSPDEPDNRFLECCEEATADYLVTGNKRHFPRYWNQTRIVSARELLDILARDRKL